MIARHEEILEKLEWKRFVRLASEKAWTEPGKKAILDLELSENWAPDELSAQAWQQQTADAASLLPRESLWSALARLSNPYESLETLKRGGVVESQGLSQLLQWLEAIERWHEFPRDQLGRAETLKKDLLKLMDPREPLALLKRTVSCAESSWGEILDQASGELARLRREELKLRSSVSQTVAEWVKRYQQQGILQGEYADQRDGYTVIPVKIQHQGEVEGVLRDTSVSKQTAYIEPQPVLELNRAHQKKKGEIAQEIFRILEKTSQALRPAADELKNAIDLLAHWDAVQARARFGQSYAGKGILISSRRNLFLSLTAHPLLWQSLPSASIVRNTILLEESQKTLLISGPNTGGKTVLLKTVGLAALCARTGFTFPGDAQPQVPFFDSIAIDLGDPQSIEGHLSSFSGHLLRIKAVLEESNHRSLVLLDEINHATDPEEGAVLSRAILEHLIERGVIVVATTHDPRLKLFAYAHPAIALASMQFDEQSKSPTYQLQFGVPGRSHALETAERLGLPPALVQKARSYLPEQHALVETQISKLQQQLYETQKARAEAEADRLEAEKLRNEWDEKLKNQMGELLQRTRSKMKKALESAQDQVREQVRRISETKNRRDLYQAREELVEGVKKTEEEVLDFIRQEAPEAIQETQDPSTSRSEKKESTATFEIGQTVRIPKWKKTGTLVGWDGKDQDKAKVAIGSLQAVFSIKELEIAQPESPPLKAGPRHKIETSAAVAPEIDLRGLRVEDAIDLLDKYLDQAYRDENLFSVTVIHGLGTGAVRESSRKLLKKLPYIKTFHDAPSTQGGSGATIVEFER